jgi:hypothetical protein
MHIHGRSKVEHGSGLQIKREEITYTRILRWEVRDWLYTPHLAFP